MSDLISNTGITNSVVSEMVNKKSEKLNKTSLEAVVWVFLEKKINMIELEYAKNLSIKTQTSTFDAQ